METPRSDDDDGGDVRFWAKSVQGDADTGTKNQMINTK